VLLLAHLLLLPMWVLLWVLIPLAIWITDRGPIFYGQRRVGQRGREFTALKFRSMVPDAESMTGPVWSPADDPRVTRVGKLLRATALDELPQVLNILKGDMSFVGPRSERPELYAEIVQQVPNFTKRLQVRPGLTGLAQVKGAYDLPPAEKLAYDLEYVQHMSLSLDTQLVLSSVWNTLAARWDRKRPP
jgi:lipopolysaccharide/colanic/teichoic acid biosynthesis glycosyltransferase